MNTNLNTSIGAMTGALLLAGAFALYGAPASAAPVFCSAPGAHPDGLATSQMTYDTQNAADCWGTETSAGPGGINLNDQTNVDALVGAEWGTGWQHLIQGDVGGGESGSFGGYTFNLSWTQDNEWLLSASGSPLPASFDFVAGLAGGSTWALWHFPSIEVAEDPTSGTWEIVWTAGQGASQSIPDLSHLTLFIREGSVAVPQPAVLALMGLGLLGMAAVRRRRRM